MVHWELWELREQRRLQEESTVRSGSILLPFLRFPLVPVSPISPCSRFSDFPITLVPLSPNIEKLQGFRHPE